MTDTAVPDPSPQSAPATSSLSRRRLLQTGGLAVSAAAVFAACGKPEEGEPGRVGYAPPVTPLPQVEVNDIVYLRTLTSLEYTVLDVYAAITDSGALDDKSQALIDRFVDDHTRDAGITSELTAAAGGEPYECANQWYDSRIIPPIVANIVGDPDQDIPPSDDPQRDMLAVSHAFESMLGASYQMFTGQLVDRQLRSELMAIGAQDGRRAGIVAMYSSGVPEGYVNPELYGADVEPDEDGLNPLWAITARFGSLAPTELLIGAPNEAGTRFSIALETPADNSYIYEGMTCRA